MKKLSLQVGDGWTRYPQSFVNAQVHRRWLGSPLSSRTSVVSNTKKSYKSRFGCPLSTPLRLGELRRYFSPLAKYPGRLLSWLEIVQSLFIMFRLRPQTLFFFQRGALSQYCLLSQRAVSGVPVFIHESPACL